MSAGLSYIHVRWLHDFPDEPTDIWIELDSDRIELRKMEFFRDGRVGYSTDKQKYGGTHSSKGEGVTPSLEEIAADPQFRPEQISREKFEERWAVIFAAR